MKKLLTLTLLGLMLINCGKNTNTDHRNPPQLYPGPRSFPADLIQKYSSNVITGERIKPIITPTNDTVLTGKAMFFKGTMVPLTKAGVYSRKKNVQQKMLAYPNRYLATNPDIYDFKQSTKDANYTLTSTLGDTLFTGIPIIFEGKKTLLMQPPPVEAQPLRTKDQALFNIQNLDVLQGMASSKIYDICVSKNGSLWLATYNGISQYDGTSFTHYSHTEGLPNGNVRAILEDHQGNLWFSPAGKGICKYDGDSLTVFDERHGNSVWPIIEDKKGNIWWGSNQGLSKFDGKHVTHYTTKEGLSQNYVESIYEDRRGNIWVGTSSMGVSKFDGTHFTHYSKKQGFPLVRVYAILEDHQGNMWFGSNGRGLVKHDGKQFYHYTKKHGLPGVIIKSMVEDAIGNLWIGTTDNGLVKFDGTYFTHFTHKEGLAGNHLLKLTLDRHQNLWLGTYQNGLVKCDFNSFAQRKVGEAFSKNIVRAFCKDEEDNLLMLTHTEGLVAFDGEYFVASDSVAFSANRPSYAMLKDGHGAIWVGIFGGLLKYEKEQVIHYLPNTIVQTLLEDKQGNLWIGTQEHGLYKYDGKQLTNYTLKDGLPHRTVLTLLEDRKGNIWIGTEKGLSKYDGRNLVNYSEKEGLSDPLIRVLFEDSQGYLWIGTYTQGLMQYDGKNFTYYTTREGLSDNLVKSIIEDKRGNLWVGTEKGLNRLKIAKQAPYKIRKFDHTDGLKALDFELNSAFLDAKDRLWWGTGKSVISLDTLAFLDASEALKPPIVRLKQVYINGQFLDYRGLGDSLKRKIYFDQMARFANYPINLSLPYEFNHLTFRFATEEAHSAHKVKYSYQIQGVDSHWSQPSVQPIAEYRNIPYGNFTLQVKAIGPSQTWSKVFNYPFTIRPPWWHTWWCRWLSVILGSVLIFAYVKRRTLSLKRRQRVLEQTIEVHTQDLRVKNEALIALNETLYKNKEEIIALKENEKRILETHVKNNENEFRLIMKSVQDRFDRVQAIKNNMTKALKDENLKQLHKVEDELQQFLESANSLQILSSRIESRYPGIIAELNTLFPHLSTNDIKHCLLIKLNLSMKEAAQMLGVSVHAVKMARKRLRKKMEVPEQVTLKIFLQKNV